MLHFQQDCRLSQACDCPRSPASGAENPESNQKLQQSTAMLERQFIFGHYNVFCRVMCSSAKLVLPLHKKLKTGALRPFELNDTKRKAVRKRRKGLVTLPALALPRLNRHFSIDGDACDTQIGCILIQEQEVESLQNNRLWVSLILWSYLSLWWHL